MPSDVRAPTFGEAVDRLIEARLRTFHTWLPAIVDSYDEEKQLVDCTAQVGLPYVDPDDGTIKYTPAPRVGRCPVGFMGAGGFRITLPIEPGKTTGVLLFSESPIVEWLLEGRAVDPKYDRRFDINDAMFIPMLRPNSAAFTDVPRSDAMTVGREDGPQMVITKDELQLGGTPSEPPTDHVALSTPTKDELTKLHDTLQSLVNTLKQNNALQKVNNTLIQVHKHVVSGAAAAPDPSLVLQSPSDPDGPSSVGDVKASVTKAK